MSPATAGRRRALRRMLDRGQLHSQHEMAELLTAEGFPVTQATVSRDLEAMGAHKVPSADGGTHYVITGDRALSGDDRRLAVVITDFVSSIESSGSLVVMRTPPGAAQVVAGAIDGAALGGVLGTVAGDDTLLVVAAEELSGRDLAGVLNRIGANR